MYYSKRLEPDIKTGLPGDAYLRLVEWASKCRRRAARLYVYGQDVMSAPTEYSLSLSSFI